MASNSTFPDEIIVEILLKLPTKSILRCNILSKHYYSLIHSQFFIRRHLNLRRLTNKLNDRLIASPMVDSFCLFNRRSGYFMELESSFSFDDDDNVSKLMISGPVDRLYCVIDHENVSRRRAITLWNPATLEEFFLPVLPITNEEDNGLAELTVEEFWDNYVIPEKCLGCGFGYDSNTNNYKVLIIYESVSDMFGDMSMYIFNLSDKTWRHHGEHIGVNCWRITSFVGVFVGGAYHWICSFLRGSIVSNILSISRPGHQIIAFDMSMESSRAISFPEVGDGYAWFKTTSIVKLDGCLALIDAIEEDVDGRCSSFNVWVMAEYGVTESWSIMYRVSLLPGIVGRFLGITAGRF
ncbi:F-box protein CPR1-like [Silene latifolia]|uniref:F-box protein CPR1-like n=1 Tax=Silene latifolia TaxID=37657 RepID=UPI003D76BD4B